MCAEVVPQALLARTAVQARRHAFKGAIGRLQTQARAVIEHDRFPNHPEAMADADYIQLVLQPTGDLLGAAETAVRRLLADNTWNPGEPASRAALEEVIRTVKGAIAEAERLRQITPPLAWREVHRDLARSAAFTVKGLIEMVAVVVASDHGGAVAREQAAQQALEEAAVRLRRIVKTVAAMTRQADLWRLDGSIDLAKAAWASAGGQPMTITEAADVVREAFGQVPGVSDAADEHILGFLPTLAVGAGVLDHDLVAAYAGQLRGVLDQADAIGAWIVEPDLLLARYARAAESMVATTEQLVRAANVGLPRRDFVKALTGVYLDQVEGPLRDLGTIILIAARAARGEADHSTYREEVIEGVKAGEVVNELVHLGTPCSEAVAMIYRNAAAHASIEITDDGLKATSRRIADGRVYETKQGESTDAQVAEDVTALHQLAPTPSPPSSRPWPRSAAGSTLSPAGRSWRCCAGWRACRTSRSTATRPT